MKSNHNPKIHTLFLVKNLRKSEWEKSYSNLLFSRSKVYCVTNAAPLWHQRSFIKLALERRLIQTPYFGLHT